MDGLAVDGTSVLSTTAVIIDTGTTQIVGDPDNVATVYGQISGAVSAPQYGDGIYTSAFGIQSSFGRHCSLLCVSVPCSFNTPITLTFSGQDFTVDPSTFNLGPVSSGSSTCVGGLASDSKITNRQYIYFRSDVTTATKSCCYRILDCRRCLLAECVHRIRCCQHSGRLCCACVDWVAGVICTASDDCTCCRVCCGYIIYQWIWTCFQNLYIWLSSL